MKKLILSVFILFSLIFHATGQTSGVKVKVNVNFNKFQSIEIGSGATPNGAYGDVVNLTYATAEDYRNGVSQYVANQLKVSSVGTGYKVKAKLSNANLTRVGSNGIATIPASDILQVKVGKGISAATSGSTLSTSGHEFLLSATSDGGSSVLAEELDVKYFGLAIPEAKVKEYFNNVGKESIAYTVDVTYEVVPN